MMELEICPVAHFNLPILSLQRCYFSGMALTRLPSISGPSIQAKQRNNLKWVYLPKAAFQTAE